MIPGHDTQFTETETGANGESKSQSHRARPPEWRPVREGEHCIRKARTTTHEVRVDPRLGLCENTVSEMCSQQARIAQKISQEKQPGLVGRSLHKTRYEPQVCHL